MDESNSVKNRHIRYNRSKESKESKESKDGGFNMEIARLSSKGQITVPIDIRKKLNLKEGDKLLFFEEGEKIVVANASIMALKEIQTSMQGEAEKQGFKSENHVNDYVKEIRKELWEKKYENND